MKRFALPLLMLFASTAHAGVIHFKIETSPANALTYGGGLSGHAITAGLEGTFSITYENNAPPVLSSFKLFLVNVSENFELPGLDIAELEGKPLPEFMSHNLEGTPSIVPSPGDSIGFMAPHDAPPTEGISTEPYSWMGITFGEQTTTLNLFSRLVPTNAIDGPTVRFQPLTVIAIPEPATIGLTLVGLAGMAVVLRRQQLRCLPTTPCCNHRNRQTARF